MKRGTFMALLFCMLLPLASLWNSAQNVRAVNVVGLFGGGAVFGAALACLVVALRAKREP